MFARLPLTDSILIHTFTHIQKSPFWTFSSFNTRYCFFCLLSSDVSSTEMYSGKLALKSSYMSIQIILAGQRTVCTLTYSDHPHLVTEWSLYAFMPDVDSSPHKHLFRSHSCQHDCTTCYNNDYLMINSFGQKALLVWLEKFLLKENFFFNQVNSKKWRGRRVCENTMIEMLL